MTRKTHLARRLAALFAVALGLACALGFAFSRAAVADEGAAEPAEGVPVYRLYNPWDGQHLFTADEGEVKVLLPLGWKDEGVAYRAYGKSQKPQGADVVDVHRLLNKYNDDHFMSGSEEEIANLVSNGWKDEGTSFYALSSKTDYPVYRLYNPYMTINGGRGNHLWTLDKNEYDTNVGKGWNGEAIQWYAIGPNEDPVPTTPVDIHGALAVHGTNLVDSHGVNFQLRGMSTHGLSFTEEGVPFKDYVNEAGFKTLRDDWGANCVRIAMYTESYMGYCNGGNKDELKGIVRRGVNAASDLGMYAIIDWHILENGNPTAREGDAREFFDQMSREFKDHVNVLYEICNEPNGGVDWATVKGYAERIIPVIRANDPDAIVIVGTPTWSQDVDQAAANPLTGASGQNTLYSLHFYANTHKQDLRDKMTKALDAGLPIFISEFGTCDSSGNGANNLWEAQQWINLANSRNVSWMNWNLSLKNETCAAIQSWCKKTSGWDTWELTESGNWVRKQMRAAAGL